MFGRLGSFLQIALGTLAWILHPLVPENRRRVVSKRLRALGSLSWSLRPTLAFTPTGDTAELTSRIESLRQKAGRQKKLTEIAWRGALG